MNNKKSKVSIIVPIYNAESTIKNCIESILKQTHNNFEIICVDDGSIDNSGILIDKLGIIDKRIKVIHKKNRGVSDARNKGIELAAGEIIGFVDVDDTIEPTMIEKLINLLEDEKLDCVCCQIKQIQQSYTNEWKLDCFEDYTILNKKEIIEEVIWPMFGIGEKRLQANSANNKLYKKSIISQNNIRFDVKRCHGEDWKFNVDYLSKANSLGSCNDKLYIYRISDKGGHTSFIPEFVDNCFEERKMFVDFAIGNEKILKENRVLMRNIPFDAVNYYASFFSIDELTTKIREIYRSSLRFHLDEINFNEKCSVKQKLVGFTLRRKKKTMFVRILQLYVIYTKMKKYVRKSIKL